MRTMKDKLANSVRQAKSGTRSGSGPMGDTPHAPAEPPAGAAPSAPAARQAPPEAPAAAPVTAVKHASADAPNPTPSAKELFPRRIWPD